MKIILSFILLSFFTFTFNTSKAQVHQSHRQPVPIAIDGNDNDWDKPLHLYDTNTGLMFSIANDNKNLYLCFEANERQKLHKLMRAGWDIELSSKDKKAKFISTITFPAVGVQANNENNKADYGGSTGENRKGKFDIGEMIDSYRLRISTLNTKGFTTQNGTLPINNNNGIKGAIGISGENIVFEFVIPLSELSTNDLFDVKELQLTVTVNPLDKSSTPGESAYKSKSDGFGGFDKGSSMGGGGHGGGHGGGGHGGGNHGGVGGNAEAFDRTTLFEKSTLKQKFQLSKS